MQYVRAKKNLGQHFLKDLNIAKNIVESLDVPTNGAVLEIGPGMGVLTKFLKEKAYSLKVVEIDTESVDYLISNQIVTPSQIISADFLKQDLAQLFSDNSTMAIIGNFPYNISSQIFFKTLENKNRVTQVVCMLQKEVAERIATGPGSKTYGILSVLLQAWYEIEYLFTVHENVFAPPPKVKSAVIRLKRNNIQQLNCNESLFFKVVKAAFNQRRKTLRNSLGAVTKITDSADTIWQKRPEQLSVADFVDLTNRVEAMI
jgi:16S rRNA (adenine1518-N6/adenine1519-N6)-dimethyltransferase